MEVLTASVGFCLGITRAYREMNKRALAEAPFAVAHQNAGGEFDTLSRIERREAGLLTDYPGLRELSVVRDVSTLGAGDRLVLGPYVIPDVAVWAFEHRPGETSPVIDAERASYVFRLDSLEPAGVPPLAEIRAPVLDAARRETKLAVARQRAEQVANELRSAPDLVTAGRAKGFRVEKIGPFPRLNPAAGLTRNPVALGAAFGLRPGEKSPLIAGETGFFVLQGIARTAADSAAWVKQKAAQRETLLRPIEQARIQQFLAALRAQAKVVDRRTEIFRPAAAQTQS